MDTWDLRILRHNQLEALEETVRDRRLEGWHLMCLVARIRKEGERDTGSERGRRVGPPFLAVLQRGGGLADPETEGLRLMGDSARVLCYDVEHARVTADLLASEGQLAEGYSVLLRGLEATRVESSESRAESAAGPGEAWQAALDAYCRRHAYWLR